MKQREHKRYVNGRYITVNPGFRPSSKNSSRAKKGLQQGVGQLVNDGAEPEIEPREPKKVGVLKAVTVEVIASFSLRWAVRSGKSGGFYLSGGQVWRVGPGSVFDEYQLRPVDFSKFNLTGARFQVASLHDTRFNLAELRFSQFGKVEEKPVPFNHLLVPAKTKISDVSFQQASLQDAKFSNVNFWGETSFREADLTGAVFHNCKNLGVLDFRGSNITEEQIRSLQGNSADSLGGMFKGEIKFDYVTLDEGSEVFGVDADDLRVLLWLKDLDVCEKDGTAVADEVDFDPDRHVIPQWEFSKLVNLSKAN